jgi:hypothetical protein
MMGGMMGQINKLCFSRVFSMLHSGEKGGEGEGDAGHGEPAVVGVPRLCAPGREVATAKARRRKGLSRAVPGG